VAHQLRFQEVPQFMVIFSLGIELFPSVKAREIADRNKEKNDRKNKQVMNR